MTVIDKDEIADNGDSKSIQNIDTDNILYLCSKSKPIDIINVELLVNLCRIRISELNGHICLGTPENFLPYIDSDNIVSPEVHQKITEADQLEFLPYQCENNTSALELNEDDFSDYRKTIITLLDSIAPFTNRTTIDDNVKDRLKIAVLKGNEYLTKRGVKIMQEIKYDWIISQPIF